MIAAEIDLSPAVVSFLMYTGSERFGLQHWSGVDTDAQGIHIDWRECNFYFFSYLSLFHFIASYHLERVTCSLYEKQGISLYCLMNRGQRECCLGLISCPLRIRNEIPSYPTKREKKKWLFWCCFFTCKPSDFLAASRQDCNCFLLLYRKTTFRFPLLNTSG